MQLVSFMLSRKGLVLVGLLVRLDSGRDVPPRPWSHTVEYAGSVCAVVLVLHALLFQIQTRRAAAAFRLIERWNDPAFLSQRKDIGGVLEGTLDSAKADLREALVGDQRERGLPRP